MNILDCYNPVKYKNKVHMSFNTEASTKRQLMVLAKRGGLSCADLINRSIDYYLLKDKNERRKR